MSTSKTYCNSIKMSNIGTSQHDRLDHYITEYAVENIATDKYLVYAYLFSDILEYVDEQNKPIEENFWAEFIKNDETTILSLIINTDLSTIRKTVDRVTDRIATTSILDAGGKYLQCLINIIEQLLSLIDYWHESLPAETEVAIDIKNIIEKELAPIIASIVECIENLPPNTTINCLYEFKKKIENLKLKSIIWRYAFKKITPSNNLGNINSIEKIYELYKYIFIICVNQIIYLQEEAKKYFEKSLFSRNHTPQVGLLIAFIELVKNVTGTINSIPNKYLDYYYTDVLKFIPNDAIPDKAYVNFVLNQNTEPISLRRNTTLTAGKDINNNDIFFYTRNDLDIDSCHIAHIHVLESVTEENSKYIPEAFDDSVLNVLSYSREENLLKPIKTNNFLLDTQIGLCVESRVLNLSAGQRKIKMIFVLTPASFKLFNLVIQKALRICIQEELNKKIYACFSIYLSVKDGWTQLPLSNLSFSIPNDIPNSIEFFLVLPEAFPALCPCQNQITQKKSKHAAIKILLNKSVDAQQFALINFLQITETKLEACIEKFQEITVQNELGLIDITKPFAPFGPTPMQKSSFFVSIKNIIFNDPKNLTLHINWNHIPFFREGFEQYYREYETELSNNSFKCRLYFYNNFNWVPINNNEEFLLFLSEEKDPQGFIGINIQTRAFAVNMQNIVINANCQNDDNNDSWNNYLKIELSSPLIGFGYTEYTSILKNLSTVDHQKNKVTMRNIPNEPFVPFIKNIYLNYFLNAEKNFTKLNLDPEESIIMHNLSIFGEKKIIASSGATGFVKFIETVEHIQYNKNKLSLYIGITKPSLTTMTLHIELEERETENKSYGYQAVFQYMKNNEWITMPENNILIDKTNRFQCSGIVKFNIPKDYSLNNSFMPINLFWLRVLINTTSKVSIPKIKGCFINAVIVERSTEGLDDENIDSILIPPNSIKFANSSYSSEIKEVFQPFSSFGFIKKENNQMLYLRASERLRHKNRPASIWDYERLILEKFPMLYTVKCINHTSKRLNSLIAPGYITIAVTLRPTNKKKSFIVPLNIINEIKNFLAEITPSTINIEITNLLYERICIITEFQTKIGYEKGIYIEKLQKELYNFISPWPEDIDDRPNLGKILSPTDIIGYMMSREYVEFISEFSILIYKNKSQKGEVIKFDSKYDSITPSYPWSIITSAPKHLISCTDSQKNNKKSIPILSKGIGNMSINKNFLIGPWKNKNININTSVSDGVRENLKESIKNKYLFAIIK